MSQTNENKKIKLLHKPPKGKLPALCLVFLWIALWNSIFQLLEITHIMPHEGLRLVNWAFFMTVAVFFLQEELTYKERFWYTLCGGTVGLLLAACVGLGKGFFVNLGLPELAATCIPLVTIIGVLILTRPFIPMFFNDVGFVYLICSFINKKTMLADLPSHLISLVLGSIILNLGATGIILLYRKHMAKKRAKQQ